MSAIPTRASSSEKAVDVKKIGSNARYEMERLLDTQVNLKLWVKVRKDWRDSELMMKNFGYNKDDI